VQLVSEIGSKPLVGLISDHRMLGGSLHQDLELAGFNGHRDSAAAIFSAFADACKGDEASGGDG
jgi:hypothetical protein